MNAPTIMVVEGNSVTRKLLRGVLELEGFPTLEAADGSAAIEAMSLGRAELVLQDLTLSDMDGAELAGRLRSAPGGHELPIIALSGFVNRLDEAQAIGGAFTDFVLKPVEPARLIETVRRYLPELPEAPRNLGRGRHVVIADDDPVQLKRFRTLLAHIGFRVTVAADGAEALERARADRPDVILTDVLMPGMDGLELCASLRRDPGLARTPVLLLSSRHMEAADREAARDVGANGLLLKNDDFEQIVFTLLQNLDDSGETPVAAVGPPQIAANRGRVQQLERQANLNIGLAQQFSLKAAQLSVVSLVTDALATHSDIDTALRQALDACLDTAAVSKAVLFLREATGRLAVRHAVGYPSVEDRLLADCFGYPARLHEIVASRTPLAIPSYAIEPRDAETLLDRAGVVSALVLPLASARGCEGALFLGSETGVIAGPEMLAFFGAIAAQIGQSIALARAFEDQTESERRFAGIFQSNPAPTALIAFRSGEIIATNERFRELMGYEANEMDGRLVDDLGLWADREEHGIMVRALGDGRPVREAECWLRRKSGEIFEAEISLERIDLKAGPMLIAMPVDITDRRRGERFRSAQLAVSRILSEASGLSDAAPRLVQALCETLGWDAGILWNVNPAGDALSWGAWWNRTSIQLPGLEAHVEHTTAQPIGGVAGSVVARRGPVWIEDLATLDDCPRAATARREGLRSACAFPITVGDRVVGIFELLGQTRRSVEPGALEHLSELGASVGQYSGRRRIEEELFERTRLATLTADISLAVARGDALAENLQRCVNSIVRQLDAMSACVWTLNPVTSVLELQATAGERLRLGGTHDDIPIGETVIGLIARERRARRHDGVLHAPGERATDWTSQDGLASFAGLPLMVEDRLVGVLAVLGEKPLTESAHRALNSAADALAMGIERKRATDAHEHIQQELLQAQKMEAVGRLAGGIAHDFNNLLTAILGFGNLLLENPETDEATRSDVEEIVRAGERASELTRQLLAFSQQQVVRPRVLDLHQVARGAASMLQSVLGEDVQLEIPRAEGLGSVLADPGQIELLLINLALNAHDAMPHGGVLTITTANADLDDSTLAAPLGVKPGRYVTIAVKDSGLGMDAETQRHIFEPFFTTKRRGDGTGLGLSTVYGIVNQCHGHIAVRSEPGQGSTFEVHLPRVDGSATQRASEAASAAPMPHGSETVLVVEDEASIRRLACQVMRSSGYTVLEADSGPHALEIAAGHPEPIHAVITDVVMPGLSGGAFVERFALIHPESRTIFMSGYPNDAVLRHGVLAPGTPFLQKPFAPRDLMLTLREVLDESIQSSH